MTRQEIINIIKNNKKYSSKSFSFFDDHLIYFLNGKEYKISIEDYWSRISFYYSLYSLNIKDIKVTIVKDKCDEKKILSKFRELIRNVDKLDMFLTNKKNHEEKIKFAISNFCKKEWSIEPNFDDKKNVTFRMNFPNSYYNSRGRMRSSYFNISREKPENITYNVNFTIKDTNFELSLTYTYSVLNKKLSLQRKDESYRDFSKDVTKIIRSEKLKNLLFKNEESN